MPQMITTSSSPSSRPPVTFRSVPQGSGGRQKADTPCVFSRGHTLRNEKQTSVKHVRPIVGIRFKEGLGPNWGGKLGQEANPRKGTMW
ncbi:hypothetical protein BaRGS_00029644 [Batillaria attramentaria]|uniref:Uncharacterized protein n=1 Tax=Batillaria attramentaria TaxID=370345 RepID=A0ABD0JWP8_9CAEN